MPQQAATIESLPQAFEVVKEMQADGLDRGEGCRPTLRPGQNTRPTGDGRDRTEPLYPLKAQRNRNDAQIKTPDPNHIYHAEVFPL